MESPRRNGVPYFTWLSFVAGNLLLACALRVECGLILVGNIRGVGVGGGGARAEFPSLGRGESEL